MSRSSDPFLKTLRAVHLRLVHSRARAPEDSIRSLEAAMHLLSSALPDPVAPTVDEEEDSFSSLTELDRPRRDRDPALVQQEINGCKSLLLEIIRRAAYDWVLYRTSRRLVQKKLAEQAFRWLFQEDVGHEDWKERLQSGKQTTSFLFICEALELDPESVREHVRRLTPKNVMSVGRPAEYRRREVTPVSPEENRLALQSSTIEHEWADLDGYE